MSVNICDKFPKYVRHDPAVPVWCVTPGEGRVIHRFFDTSPFSPSGRYLALFRLPYENRPPAPADAGQIVLVDLEAGTERVVAETRGWEFQMGANVNWGADDHTLFFNDVDPATWTPFAVRLDPISGESHRLGGCVYQASPDGRWLASASMAEMRRTQWGYGVVIPDDRVRINTGLRDDDGLFLTDTQTGECKLLLSIKDAVEQAAPAVGIDSPEQYEIYGFHAKWNRLGDRLIFTIRWYPAGAEPRFNVISETNSPIRFTVFTLRSDGTDVRTAVPAWQWDKGGHHINFFPDGRRLSMNLNIDREGLRFVKCNLDGTELVKMLDDVPGSGHPTVHPDGRHVLTDAYADGQVAFGDGTIPLRWIDLAAGTEQTLVRIHTKTPYETADPALRVDPHPAWDRTHTRIAFNAFEDGTRRVFVTDMSEGAKGS